MLKIPQSRLKDKFNIYNIATRDQINVIKVADIVSSEMGLKPDYVFTGGKIGWKGDLPVIRMSIYKALKLGWKPKHNSEEAIRLAVEEML